MKEFTNIILLLLFEFRGNHGHSLSKIEMKNMVDTYEVKEDNSSLTITSTKAETPTLREIIYYHIIEKPYVEYQVEIDDTTDYEQPDTTRHITNGHGYQFLEEHDEDEKDNAKAVITPIIDERIKTDNFIGEDTNHKEPDIKQIGADKTYGEQLPNNGQVKDLGGTSDEDFNDEFTPVTLTNTEELEHTETSTVVVTETRNSTTVHPEFGRRKRDLDYSKIPKAPTLPELRMDGLPEFIKTLISKEPETVQKAPARYLEEFEEQVDNLEDAINRAEDGKIMRKDTYGMSLAGNSGDVWNDINKARYFYHIDEPEDFAKTTQIDKDLVIDMKDKITGNAVKEVKLIKPEFDKIKENVEDKIIKPDIDKVLKNKERSRKTSTMESLTFADEKLIDKTTESTFTSFIDNVVQERKGRNYGMRLVGDSGTVWNDLDKTHYVYHVGEPETLTSTTTPEEKTLKPAVAISETTQKPNDDTTKNSLTPFEEENVEFNLKEIEASIKEIESIFKEMINNSRIKPEATTESSKVSENSDSIVAESTMETLNTSTAGDVNENVSSTSKPNIETERPSSSGNKAIHKEKTEDEIEPIDERKDKSKKPTNSKDQRDFVQELIKNKYFWEWVKDSSKAYLEILMKKVDALISAEVEKQIKQYFEAHKVDMGNCKQEVSKNENKNSTVEVKPVETNNVTDRNNNTNATIDQGKPNNDTGIDKHNTTVVNHTQNPNLNKTEDGNEQTSKKHKDKETVAKKSTSPVIINAQNVYGNSVGSAKVTNIFIFNISNTSDFNTVKPLNNGTNGVYVFGVDGEKPADNQTSNKTETSNDTTEKEEAGTTEKVNTSITEQSTAITTETNYLTTTEKVVSTSEKVTSASEIPDASTTENIDLGTSNKDVSTTERAISTTDKIDVSPTEKEKVTASEQVTITSEKPNASTTEVIDDSISSTEKNDVTDKVTNTTEIKDVSTEKADVTNTDAADSSTEKGNKPSSEQVASISEKPDASVTENVTMSSTEKVNLSTTEVNASSGNAKEKTDKERRLN